MNKRLQKLADTYTLQKITQAAGYTQADKEANNKPRTIMNSKFRMKNKLTKNNITKTPIRNRKRAYKTMEKFWDNNVQLVKDHLPVPPRQGLIWDNVKSKWVRPDMAGKTITEVGGEKRIRGAGTGVHQRSVQTKRGLRRGEAGQLFRQPGQRRQKRI
tara:strand:+ start:72 stop:545 length:474 start_codon:yes stop_codon:yes gene_type:complete